MIVVVKRSNLFILAMSLFLAFSTAGAVKKADVVPVNALSARGRVIVIDPGHGGLDGGAVGKNGTVEKELNLQIGLKLENLLKKTGAKVILTRKSDSSLAETKKEDMQMRKVMKEGSEADIFVSIHMNKFTQEKYSGAQVFYSDDDKSAKLATCIQASLKNILDPTNTREAKVAGEQIFLLRKSDVPAVIVECGFISNEAEEARLKQPDYQEKVAWAIYTGITEYFGRAE